MIDPASVVFVTLCGVAFTITGAMRLAMKLDTKLFFSTSLSEFSRSNLQKICDWSWHETDCYNSQVSFATNESPGFGYSETHLYPYEQLFLKIHFSL